MDFGGRRALVTGAGKGIGREIAKVLADRGAEVVALSRLAEDLASLSTETGCLTITADLADLAATLDEVRRALPIHLLVNNAGITALKPFLETTPETFGTILQVNTVAPMALSQLVAGDLIRRGATGAIVNVSSNASRRGIQDHTAYCASKAALDALTRVMALELGPHGIRTNSVNPSVTMTPMGRMAWSDPAKSAPVLARIPLGRFLDPHDVASVVAFLLSDDAAMVNGACLEVDGGFQVT